MLLRHVFAALLTIVLWGLNNVAVKVGITDSSPLWFVSLRLLLTGILITPFVPVPGAHWRDISLLALFYSALHLGLITYGMAGLDAATSVIIVQLGTPFTILMGRLFYGETFGYWRWAGVALAFSGIGFLAGEPRIAAPQFFAATIAAMAMWAIGNVFIKRLHAVSPLAITGWSSLLAAPLLLVISFATESGQFAVFERGHTSFWLAISYAVVASSIIAHSLWNGLLHRYPMSTVAPFNLLVPIVGFSAAIAFLDEPLTNEKMIGGLLTFAGVTLIQIRLILKRLADRNAAQAPVS